MYILAGSELEVNIETAMRNKVLKVSHKIQATAVQQRGLILGMYNNAQKQRGSTCIRHSRNTMVEVVKIWTVKGLPRVPRKRFRRRVYGNEGELERH